MSFPCYNEYHDSGLNWLGQVPTHWSLRRLGYYFDERREKVSDRDYEPLSVTKDGIVPQLETAAKTDDGDNRKKVCKGDFVINSRSDRKGSAGLSGLDGSVSLISTVLRPQETVHGPFVHHLLRCIPFQEEFYRFGKGIVADLWSTNYSSMSGITLAMPPLSEQHGIANFLDRQTAKIDALIAEQQRLVEIFKEKLSSLALSGFQDEKPNYQRIGRITRTVSRPVDINADEEYEPLGLFNRGRGIFHKQPRRGADMGDSDFFYVEAGDLVLSGQFAWEGSVAVVGKSENGCVVSHRYPIIQGDNENCLTEFLLALLWTEHGDFLLNQCSRGAAGRNRPLNLGLLLKQEIALPCLTIQRKIQEEYRKYVELKNEQSRQTELALEHRSALISAAVTGQIDVREMAAEEEP